MNHPEDLEDFVQAHRRDFEQREPRPELWDGLAGALRRSGGYRPSMARHLSLRFPSARRWMSAAAIFGSIILLAAFVRTYQVTSSVSGAAIPADLQDARAYYEQLITAKIEQIKALDARTGDRDTSLWHLFGQRDGEYSRLREALVENPGNAHVRAAFVEYYRSRLEVLNGIETHIQNKGISDP